ncbi:hypothetical protein C0J52_02833 [Blattella germanica]|nr:hypothetical protein C0J52_02833 [Blattella germanica]
MFDGIENVSLDLENDDFKIYVNDIQDLIKVNEFFSELQDIKLALLIRRLIQDAINKLRLPDTSIETCTRIVSDALPEACNYLLTDPEVFHETKNQV